MRPAKVSAQQAEAMMQAQRDRGIAVPKPVPILKRRKPIKRGGWIKRTKRPSAISNLRRERIKAWPAFREAIFKAHDGICYWCGKPCPLEDGTAEHIVPYARTHLDVETLCAWIHQRGFPMSCHGAKSSAGFAGQVAGLRWNAEKYGLPKFVSLSAPPTTMREGQREERGALWRALNQVQAHIDIGRRPSLLTRAV